MIKESQVHIAATKTPVKFSILPILIGVLVLLALGAVVYSLAGHQIVSGQSIKVTQQTLEQKYGLRVNLVAVTASGGFVDLRISIVDGEKAKILLSDKKNFPTLVIGSRVILNAPDDVKSQEIRFENGGTMFIMYGNARGAVKQGTPVTILFGDVAVEPIDAR